MKQRIWTVALVALAVAWAAYWWSQRTAGETAQYRTAKIERGNLQATVAASGAVNPVALVTVGTQVSGQISELLVDFNSEVKAGQLLARIDPQTFEYRLRSAQADLDSARAAVSTALANLLAAQAQVSRAQVDLTEAQRDLERKQSLVEKQFIAQSEADKARALVNTTQEVLKAVQAQVGVTQAGVRSAQASVAQREATLAQARIDLERTRITSPVNGIVIKRAIERGQTVAASLQAPELFTIAQNLHDMQVDAAIDESDVGRLHTGQSASFTVDAFPGQTFEGQIKQVRKAASNVANVVTYVAVVAFANPEGKLLPGMTANVRVVTDQRQDALKVPNAALRMRIAGLEPGTVAQSPAAKGPGATAPIAETAQKPAPANGTGGNGPMAEWRNKLVTELQLTSEQVEKVDAIYAGARPQFMQLRELPAEEKNKAREKVMAEVRAQIETVLTAVQKPQYAKLQAAAASRTATRGRIYVLDAQGKPKALNVRLGVSDGSMTELLPGRSDNPELAEGALVIVGSQVPSANNSSPPRPSGPRPPF